MKNCLVMCTILGMGICSASVNADTVLGGYVGASVWNMGLEGGFANQENLTNFAFDDQTNGTVYAALEHPIPLIPNIKLVRTTLDTNGLASLDSEFRFGDELFTVNSDLSSELSLESTDIILYYEILDNDIVSFDVGLNGKNLDGTVVVQELEGGRAVNQTFKGLVPMVYSKLSIGIPTTGLSAYIEGSYLSLDDNTLSDFQAAISYSFVESLALDISVEGGYKLTTLELDDLDDIYTNLEFSGVYIGLEFDF